MLSCFTEITAGYKGTPGQRVGKISRQGFDGNTSRLRTSSSYFNMFMSEQAKNNMTSNAMFRRNVRSITDKNNFFHHLHKATRKNEYGLVKHISKYPVHKTHDKSREGKKSLHRRIVKTFHPKVLHVHCQFNRERKLLHSIPSLKEGKIMVGFNAFF